MTCLLSRGEVDGDEMKLNTDVVGRYCDDVLMSQSLQSESSMGGKQQQGQHVQNIGSKISNRMRNRDREYVKEHEHLEPGGWQEQKKQKKEMEKAEAAIEWNVES